MLRTLNFSDPSRFRVEMPWNPELNQLIRSVSIPAFSFNSPSTPSPFGPIARAPDQSSMSQISISYVIDEEFLGYRKLADWALRLTGVDFEDRAALDAGDHEAPSSITRSDIVVTILSSANNPVFRIRFINVQPTELGGFELNSNAGGEDLLSTANFNFDKYVFESVTA